jgi:hypothetical protein
MKKLITGFFVLIGGLWFWGTLATGCGNSNSATAPVTVTVTQQATPTCGGVWGYFQSPGAADGYSTGFMRAFPVTLGTAAKTLDMSIYLGTTATGVVELSVYSDTLGSPHTFLDGGATSSPVANSWNTVSLTGVSLAAGTYWLAVESQNTIYIYDSGSQSATFYTVAQAYGLPPSTMPTSGTIGSSNAMDLFLTTVCP